MGSVYLRGNTWVGKFKDENGIWKRKALGQKGVITKTMAREKVKGYEKMVERGEYDRLKAIIPSVKQFSKDYLNHVQHVVQKRSWQRDHLCLRHLINFFGDTKLHKIHPKDIDDYKRYRLTRVAPATVNRELEVFRYMFNLAERWNLFFGKNPVSKSGLLKLDNKKERILNIEEESRLLKACPPYLRNIIICSLQTGMRKGEIISLRWTNVDFENNLITIDQTNSKSKKQRKIPINTMLRSLLLELKLRSSGHEYVFTNSIGLPYKRQDSLNRAFQLALNKACIEGLRFHDLRHTAATRMVEANAPIVAIKEILGHSSLEMTMRYAHPHDSLINAVECLSSYYSVSFAEQKRKS